MSLETHPDLPKGAYPCFLAAKTQEIHGIVQDDHVTEEKPDKFISLEGIKADLMKRQAVCDFSPFKDLINAYKYDEVLIVYDFEFAYGQNFYLCLTASARDAVVEKMKPVEEDKPSKQKHVQKDGEEDGGEDAEGSDASGEDDFNELEGQVFTYEPPESKVWISKGSEFEIQEEQFVPSRKPIKFIVSRQRRDFGAPIALSTTNTMTDVVADEDKPRRPSMSLERDAEKEDEDVGPEKMELEKVDILPDQALLDRHNVKTLQSSTACQAIQETSTAGAQTNWTVKKNATMQTEPRQSSELTPYPDQDTGDIINPMEIDPDVLRPAFDTVMKALEQNAIGNLFVDDWEELGRDDEAFGSSADTHLREYQSFTDLTYSKDKRITWTEWHPTIQGILACSCAKRMSLDERIESVHKNIMNPSYILIWSFSDPIHPKLLLEAPDDVCSFKFCPTDPNVIIGGCFNGQVAIWDIHEYVEKLATSNSKSAKKTQGNYTHAMQFGEEPEPETPKVPFSAVSAIDKGSIHKAPVSFIDFIPNHFEFDKQGNACQPQNPEKCVQVLSCASDGYIAIWDLRKQKSTKLEISGKDTGKDTGHAKILSQNEFAHLDLVWKPLVKIHITAPQQTTFMTPVSFSLFERFQIEPSEAPKDRDRIPEKAASNKQLDKAQGISTDFFAGTDDGVVIKSKITYEKDNESGKMAPSKAQWMKPVHDGYVHVVAANPFLPHIVLSVGSWNFTIWDLSKKSIDNGTAQVPIMSSPLQKTRYSAASWSETRPACFFLGQLTGGIEIWDILERTNEPALMQSISSIAITSIKLKVISQRQHLLAISDAAGTVHILQVPYILRVGNQSNELVLIENYFNREIERISYFHDRIDYQSSIKAETPANDQLDEHLDEAVQIEQEKTYYDSFLKIEKKIEAQMA